MNPTPAALLALTLFSVLSCSALAQGNAIYRCGPEGRELSQTPCPGGQVLPTAPAPSEQQRREAADIAKREATLARQMERDRQQREATERAEASGAMGIQGRGPVAAAAPEGGASRPSKVGKRSSNKPYKPEGFTSTGPKPPKPRKAASSPA